MSMNKVLFKSSHTHQFASCLCILVASMAESNSGSSDYGLQSLIFLLPGCLWKKLDNPWSIPIFTGVSLYISIYFLKYPQHFYISIIVTWLSVPNSLFTYISNHLKNCKLLENWYIEFIIHFCITC